MDRNNAEINGLKDMEEAIKMTCIRDIITEEGLEREFVSIRKFFRSLKEGEKPLRIEWGTKHAFEPQEKGRR